MAAPFDVFLSHNSRDKPAVEAIARRLEDEAQLKPFLDKWHLVPGDTWQEALEEAIGQAKTCAVFVGPDDISPWEHEEMRALIERRVQDRSFRVIPVLLPGAERGERGRLPAFLTRTTWVEFRTSVDDDDAFHRLVSGIRGIAPGRGDAHDIEAHISPYRGLQVFEAEHARFFFGREATTEWLLDELRGNRFLAVIGPSGSGKSSLVRAGLVPALTHGGLPGSENWLYTILKPGRRPLENLALAVRHLAIDGASPPLAGLIDSLATDKRALHLEVRSRFTQGAERDVVVVVDQFEEVFTQCQDEARRLAFLENLLYASSIDTGPLVVILTMRADFYGKCALYPDLASRITDHQMLVTPLAEHALREAMVRPAQSVGLELENGLEDALLRDVRSEPGALPLLQHALFELWQRRKGRVLTLEAYHSIGGVRGAIAQRARALYQGFEEDQKHLVRHIFLRLIQPGEGTEDTRRRATLSELVPAHASEEDVHAVIDAMAGEEARLLTTGSDMPGEEVTIEVAHEALIHNWEELQGWIEADREYLTWRARVRKAMDEWMRLEKDFAALLRGAALLEAEEHYEERKSELSEDEVAYIESSLHYRKVTQERKEAARRWEFEQTKLIGRLQEEQVQEERKRALLEHQRATEQRAAARRLRVVLGITAGIAVLAIGAALWGSEQARDAERQTRVAESRRLAMSASTVADARKGVSLLLGVEAYRQQSTVEAATVLLNGLQRHRGLLRTFYGHHSDFEEELTVSSVAFGPDPNWVASGGADGTIRLWNLETGEQNITLTGHRPGDDGKMYVNALEFHPTVPGLASGGTDGTIRFWDLNRQDPLMVTLDAVEADFRGDRSVYSLAFTAQGDTLISGGGDGIVRLWDTRNAVQLIPAFEALGTTESVNQAIYGVAISPGGSRALSGGADGRVRLSNVGSRSAIWATQVGAGNEILDVAFNSNASLFAAVGSNSVAVVWNEDGTVIHDLGQSLTAGAPPASGVQFDLAIHPVDDRLASAGGDGRISLIDFSGYNDAYFDFRHGHEDAVVAVDFSPDGSQLVSGGVDGTVRLWSTALGEQKIAADERYGVLQLVFLPPNGNELVAMSAGGSLATLHTTTLREKYSAIAWDERDTFLRCMAADRTGTQLVTGDAAGGIRLWQRTTEGVWEPTGVQYTHPEIEEDRTADIRAITFAENNRSIVFGDAEGRVWIWDAANRAAAAASIGWHQVNEHDEAFVYDVIASPDGRYYYSAGSDATIRKWHATTHEPAGDAWIGHGGRNLSDRNVLALAIRSAGDLLASAGSDGTVRLWDAESGAQVGEPLQGHQGYVRDVAFSPNDEWLASADSRGEIRLWHVAGGEPIGSAMEGHYSALTSIAFSQDGRWLASSGEDDTIRLWDVDPESWIERTCAMAGRNMTREEWNTYVGSDIPYRITCPEFSSGAALPQN